MHTVDEVTQLRARVCALEDLLVVALALAIRGAPEEHKEMMDMWLMATATVDSDVHNKYSGLTNTEPVAGEEAMRNDSRQKVAERVVEALPTMFGEEGRSE